MCRCMAGVYVVCMLKYVLETNIVPYDAYFEIYTSKTLPRRQTLYFLLYRVLRNSVQSLAKRKIACIDDVFLCRGQTLIWKWSCITMMSKVDLDFAQSEGCNQVKSKGCICYVDRKFNPFGC